jgi:hypothetical protein
MTTERTEFSKPAASSNLPVVVEGQDKQPTQSEARADEASRREATTTERAEQPKGKPGAEAQTNGDKKPKPPKPVSEAKLKMQRRLPALEDDAYIGVEKEQIVTRDGKADLAFIGTLIASAAPTAARKGHWDEYRIYETSAGKHVFSKVNRTVYAEEDDTHEADVFDPSPASVPSQLLRSAREMARSKTLTWMDAAVAFFGYDPLAKVLYRKLSVRFEEQIG